MEGAWQEKVRVGENTRPRELSFVLGPPPRKLPMSAGHRGLQGAYQGASSSLPPPLTMKKAFRAGESEGAAVVLPAVLPVSGAMLTVCDCWCSPGSPGIMFLSASSLSLGLSSKGQRPRCHLPAPASLCSKIICSPPRMALPCCK